MERVRRTKQTLAALREVTVFYKIYLRVDGDVFLGPEHARRAGAEATVEHFLEPVNRLVEEKKERE